jgi:hypothetical protein
LTRLSETLSRKDRSDQRPHETTEHFDSAARAWFAPSATTYKKNAALRARLANERKTWSLFVGALCRAKADEQPLIQIIFTQ